MLERDLATASRHNRLSKHYFAKASHPKRRASEIALNLAVATLAADVEQVKALLPEARTRFYRLRAVLGQDYLASQIVLAHRLIGEERQALDLFDEYVQVYRREQFVLPEFLVAAVSG